LMGSDGKCTNELKYKIKENDAVQN
jgi:hypothetical protein